MTIQERIERCKGCDYARNECCSHTDALVWYRVNWEAGAGIRPWIWDVDRCPDGRDSMESPEITLIVVDEEAVEEPNYMSADEFRSSGLLQEINRMFLHPRGLAMGVCIDDDGHATGGFQIIDSRDDPEGMIYADEMLDSHDARKRAANVARMAEEKIASRMELLGYIVQPIPGYDDVPPMHITDKEDSPHAMS